MNTWRATSWSGWAIELLGLLGLTFLMVFADWHGPPSVWLILIFLWFAKTLGFRRWRSRQRATASLMGVPGGASSGAP